MNGLALSPAQYNLIELCAGVGGLGLGIKIARPGARGICYVERELYGAATLAARMEAGELAPAPIWDDLGSFDGRPFRGKVDCIASGDPCQPNSVAGKRAGSDDDRWLIDQVLRVVDECRPHRFLRENVTGNCDGQLEALVPALEGLGYRVAAGIFSAAEVGASHKRERLFILADHSSRGFGIGRDEALEGGCRYAHSGDPQLADPESRSRGMDSGQGRSGKAPAQPRGRGDPMADDDSGNDQGRRRQSRGRAEFADSGGGLGSAREIGLGRDFGRLLADDSGPGFQGREFGRACDHERLGPDAYGSAAEFCGALLFAPGPADCAWPIILEADPLLAPAIGQIDLWAAARRNLGIPPLFDAIGRRGGMVRDLDPATAAKVKSEVHRIAHGLAYRLDSLRACGNGVFPLAASVAWLSLELKLAEAARSDELAVRAA